MDWHPCDHRYHTDLKEEDSVHIAGFEVGLEQDDGHEVGHGRREHYQDHLHAHVVDLGVDVEELDEDERGEGDRDNIDVGVVEEQDSK